MSDYPTRRASRGEVDQFISRSRQLADTHSRRPRLLFAIDATASRQPTWDRACELQNSMFMATRNLGGLAVQLCYYRGHHELRASRWLLDEMALLQQMNRVRCEGGLTQIERLLNHALLEHAQHRVRAVVFIGDAVEESVDRICHKAGECGMRSLPLFMFQEGRDAMVEDCFRRAARLSNGAWARFDHSSPNQLAELLGAVASYAAAGTEGLLEYSEQAGSGGKMLLQQLNKDR